MTSYSTGEKTYQTIRKVAQLRRALHRLPHVATPHEENLLRQFEQFVQKQQEDISLQALLAGFRSCWRRSHYATIIAVAQTLPVTTLQQ